MSTGPVQLRLARPSDLRRLRDVEASGTSLFVEALGEPLPDALTARPPEGADRVVAPGFIWVADVGRQVVGFVHVLQPAGDLGGADGWAHLEQLSVLPEHGRAGIGTRLVHAAMEEARWNGAEQLSLCTYRDVAFNGPFYARLGFAEVAEPTEWQARLRRHEQQLGLDRAGVRVVMSAPLLRR